MMRGGGLDRSKDSSGCMDVCQQSGTHSMADVNDSASVYNERVGCGFYRDRREREDKQVAGMLL